MPDTVVYVDLDDTLARTDTLWESLVLLLKHKPWMVFVLPFWLPGGKAAFKRRLARSVVPEAGDLVYREELLQFLRERKNEGDEIVLATAADLVIAQAVADHIGLFSGVLASDGETNLSGEKKHDAIRRHAAGRRFEYIGDSRTDIPIWEGASAAHLVTRNPAFAGTLPHTVRIQRTFHAAGPSFGAIVRMLRVSQWIKSLLLFAPIVLSHKVTDATLVWMTVAAFFSFSLCASGVYVLNDLFDLGADRRHPEKRERPLANGTIPIPLAFALSAACLATSILIAAIFLPRTFLFVLIGYVVLNELYSLVFKRIVILDVVILSLFYAYRIFAGSIATGIPITHWLLAFAAFFFLGLAILKRFSELRLLMRMTSQETAGGRGYRVQDADVLRILGVNSGFLAVLILTLYLNSPDVTSLYPRPLFLWGVVFCLVYWIARLWLLAERGNIHDDPLVFTTKDRASYATGLIILAILIFASLPK